MRDWDGIKSEPYSDKTGTHLCLGLWEFVVRRHNPKLTVVPVQASQLNATMGCFERETVNCWVCHLPLLTRAKILAPRWVVCVGKPEKPHTTLAGKHLTNIYLHRAAWKPGMTWTTHRMESARSVHPLFPSFHINYGHRSKTRHFQWKDKGAVFLLLMEAISTLLVCLFSLVVFRPAVFIHRKHRPVSYQAWDTQLFLETRKDVKSRNQRDWQPKVIECEKKN